MATHDECSDEDKLDALMIVHTSADHFSRRKQFRTVYSSYRAIEPYRLKVVFLIGHVRNAEVQILLEQENRRYGDTIVGDFMDTYQNLTLKAVMGYRWVTETCRQFPLLIKMDDDVLLDVPKFFSSFWSTLEPKKKQNTIFCQFWRNAVVGRSGKWKVEKGLFPNESYPFPYCSGFLVLVTPDLVKSMYNVGKNLDFFWIDDVFLYGMVPAVIKNVKFHQIGQTKGFITMHSNIYKKCINDHGLKCKTWAVLTSSENEFQDFYTDLNNLYIEKKLNFTIGENNTINSMNKSSMVILK